MDRDLENIGRYLEGTMSPEEVKAFENEVSNNTALKEALEEEKTARNLITAVGRLELKDTFEGYEAEMESTLPKHQQEVRVIPLWVRRAIPMAAMIAVFVGVYWFMLGDDVTSDKVYTTYFETYEAPTALRDSQTDTPVHWNTAVRYYNEGKYDEALRNFLKSEEEDIPEYLIDFYAGMCSLSIEEPNYNTAVNYFLEVERGDNDYREQAMWYRGLALLGNGEKHKALAVFHTIVESQSYGYRDAQKIIKLNIED